MRILITGSAVYPAMNGQAVFTENLTEGLAQRGNEVLSIFPSETGYAYQAIRNNVHIEALRSNNLNIIHAGVNFSFFSQNAIRRIIQSFRPEIVHVQDHYPNSLDTVRVARQYKIHLIGTNHFMPENLASYVPGLSRFKPIYNWIGWTWMLRTYNQLDVVTAQSKASTHLMRMNGLKIPAFAVSCGIDLKRFHPDPGLDRAAIRRRYGLNPDRKLLLFVGRLDPEKKIDVLLRAIKILNREDIQLAIAGKGAAQKNLLDYTHDLGLDDNQVHFTGYIPAEDLPAVLNSADIFCMPSEAELLSIASLEAMACGKPVLLANAVALPELVTEGVNGYLFRPGDAADAARYMALLADHPEKWARMSVSSLEKANYHSLENTVKQYENIYNNLVAGVYSNPAQASIKTIPASTKRLVHNKK